MSFYPSVPDNSPISLWEKAPLLRVALCLMAGIGMGWLCHDFIDSWVWVAVTAFLGILAILSWSKGKNQRIFRRAGLLALGSCLTSGAALVQMRYESLQADFPDQPQLWIAEVTHRHKLYDNGISLDVRLQYPQTYEGQTVRLRIAGDSARQLIPGERLTFRTRLELPHPSGNPNDFNYRSYLLTHGITGTGFVQEKSWASLPSGQPIHWKIRLLRFRQRLTERYALFLHEEVLDLVSALTLGDQTTIRQETRDLFSDTGTSHVLALSGLHLGILYTLLHLAFLRWFRRRIPFVVAHLFTVCALWFFVFLAGAPLSLQRAAFMFTLWIGCSCMQRTHGTGLNNWALAAIVLLLLSPLTLFDVSFQMSFSAVFAILLCNDYLWNRHALPDWWNGDEIDLALLNDRSEADPVGVWRRSQIKMKRWMTPRVWNFLKQTLVPFFTVSLSAQLGTLPFILYYFHQFTPYTLLANIIVIPAAYLLIGSALLFFLLPIPALQSLLAELMKIISQGMMNGLEEMTAWPGATLKAYPSLLTLCAATLLPFLLYALWTRHRKRIRTRLIYSITFCLATLLLSVMWTSKQRQLAPQLMVYNVPRATLIHFIVSNGESYLYSSENPVVTAQKTHAIRQNFWEPYDLKEPLPVSQTHFRSPYLLRKNDVFLFGNETLVLLHHRVSPRKGKKRIPVQTLLIQRGCYDSLAVIRQLFAPQHIVLDRSLSTRLRQRWKKECKKAGIPCHDLRKDGAFIHRVSR